LIGMVKYHGDFAVHRTLLRPSTIELYSHVQPVTPLSCRIFLI
jgi:hypothetical protein